MNMRVDLSLRTMLSAVVLCGFAGVGMGEDAVPGIVKEKPASGPFVETEQGFMVPYTIDIPGSDVSFEMIPVPGGEFVMGSPDDQEGRNDDEGPQRTVSVKPFWMGKYEVTWKEYFKFMELHDAFKAFEAKGLRKITDDNRIDVITAPSTLYDPSFTFEAGDGPDQPAVTVTQYAAKQYTKWISLLTDQFFRLPTEAEWEYACRAGADTAFYFGDDIDELGDYAWYFDNSDEVRQDVGQKKPNAFGLYDMLGNAAEWVLDGYDESGYQDAGGATLTVEQAFYAPTDVFPRVVRGGSFELDAEQCRCASRLTSHEYDWKDQDPNIPASPWWFTSYPATGVGLRLMRPLEAPASREAREEFWKPDLEELEEVAESRIDQEGRGARGLVDKELPNAIEEIR